MCRWIGPRLVTWGEIGLAAFRSRMRTSARLPKIAMPGWLTSLRGYLTQRQPRQLATKALILAACIAMVVPTLSGLLTVSQAEGYTSEWLNGENSSLQVAYPAYADGTQWVTDHTKGWVTVTLIGTPGSLDYWMQTRQYLYPERIRLTPSNLVMGQAYVPPSVPKGRPLYLIWPAHLIQREFPTLPHWQSKVVATIKGGVTIYCYIIRVQ
jgi:hypothetical protein